MGKAPCCGDRALRLSGGNDGLSLFAVCSNKLLDLERKFQTHPQPLFNTVTPPLFLMPQKSVSVSVRHSSRKPPPCVFLQPTSSAPMLPPPSLLRHGVCLLISLLLLIEESQTLGSGKRLKNLSQEGTHTQTSTCDKPPPNNGCWLRERGGRRGSGSFLDGLIGA